MKIMHRKLLQELLQTEHEEGQIQLHTVILDVGVEGQETLVELLQDLAGRDGVGLTSDDNIGHLVVELHPVLMPHHPEG